MSKLIVTVDTETYRMGESLPPFQHNLYGQVPEGTFGVEKIMEICDRYHVPASFFVDVYMHHAYGREPVDDLCRRIQDAGHDVQLHAHPVWIPGSHSNRLCEFSLEQQVEIIREGREFVARCTGRPPLAFRAGAYTANLDTMRALKRNGIIADSSYFAFHRNCELSGQLKNRYANSVFMVEDVVEIPVTTYWLLNNEFSRKTSKIDVNACSLAEMMEVIPQLLSRNMGYIILFLHSFSFIRWKRDYSGIVPDLAAMERFESLMQALAERDPKVEFCTMEDAAKALAANGAAEPDFIPRLSWLGLCSRAKQRLAGWLEGRNL